MLPLHADAPGHWTLLALERIGSGPSEPACHAAAPSSASSSKPADPVTALKLLNRQAEEDLVVHQLRRPVLPPATGWRARYYETLKEFHLPAWRKGRDFLRQLDMGIKMPEPGTRENVSRQTAADCGWWVLHHVEEESRRKRGEGKWVYQYDLKYRVSLLQKLKAKLQLALEEWRKETKEKIAKEKAATTGS